MKCERIDGALLMGVCASIARTFNWNVWVLRGLFAAFLLIKTIWAIAAYAGLAGGADVILIPEIQFTFKSRKGFNTKNDTVLQHPYGIGVHDLQSRRGDAGIRSPGTEGVVFQGRTVDTAQQPGPGIIFI